MELALLPFPFDWDQANTLQVVKSSMLPELSPTPAMMTLISAMTPVSLSLNPSPLIASLPQLLCHHQLCPFLKEHLLLYLDGVPPQKVVHCLPHSDKLQSPMLTMMPALMLMDQETLSVMS